MFFSDLPVSPSGNDASNPTRECAICLEAMTENDQYPLQCGHCLHNNCVRLLRNIGVAKVCPLCRARMDVGGDALSYKSVSDALHAFSRLHHSIPILDRYGNLSTKNIFELKGILTSIEIGAENGNPDAYNVLAFFCANGIGIPIDLPRAHGLWRNASLRDHARGQNNYGLSFLRGSGCVKNVSSAFHWISKSAAADDQNGKFNLAICLLKGFGCNKDEKAAFHLFKDCASSGYFLAFHFVGHMYRFGTYVPKNVEMALQNYKEGSDLSDGQCSDSIGTMYGCGELSEPD